MGVPFEALLPYGIIIGMFTFTSVSLGFIQRLRNDGKPTRYSIDKWDKQSKQLATSRSGLFLTDHTVMDRDFRLTGSIRGQTDNVKAPLGFELNNPWRLEERFT